MLIRPATLRIAPAAGESDSLPVAGRLVLLFASLSLAWQAAAAEPPITAAAFAPDGQSIVVGSQSGLRICGWPNLTERHILETSLAHVNDLVFAPDGKTLAAVGGRPAELGRIELYAWPECKSPQRQTIGDDLLYRVAWHHSGDVLVMAGPDRGITLFDRTANTTHQLEGHSQDVVTIACLPDGHFISGSRDATIRVWEQPSNELLRTLSNHLSEIHDVAVRPGSTHPYVIASSSADRTVRFWWPIQGRMMRFAKLPSPALDIDWTPDGSILIAACADGHLRAIDPDSVQVTRDVEVGDGWLDTLAIAPDGASVFVGGSDGLMRAVRIR